MNTWPCSFGQYCWSSIAHINTRKLNSFIFVICASLTSSLFSLFIPYILWICLMSHVSLVSWMSITHYYGISLTLHMTCQLFNQICSFVHRFHGLQHFILLSLTLTLPGGYKVSTKQNHGASFSPYFSADQDEFWYSFETIMLNIVILFLSEILWNKGNNYCFTNYSRKLMLACTQTFMNQFSSNFYDDK